MRARPILLLTRPQAQAERFGEACRTRFGTGLDIVISPLLEIRLLPAALDVSPYQGFLFTSENGVWAAGKAWPRLRGRAFCVGSRTAEAAEAAGFAALSAEGDADALVQLVTGQSPETPLLHIRGRHSRGQVAERLSSAGIETHEAELYDQIAQSLTEEANSALLGDRPVILPLFSPRTAAIFWQDRVVTAPLHVVALSQAVADVQGDRVTEMRVAARPDGGSMLDAIEATLAAIGVEGGSGAG